jgi:hypothetical protein
MPMQDAGGDGRAIAARVMDGARAESRQCRPANG